MNGITLGPEGALPNHDASDLKRTPRKPMFSIAWDVAKGRI
jgi:hypothetical protein